IVPWRLATHSFRSAVWDPHATMAIRAIRAAVAARMKRQAEHLNGAEDSTDRTLPRPARMETSRERDQSTRGVSSLAHHTGPCSPDRPAPVDAGEWLMRYDEPL